MKFQFANVVIKKEDEENLVEDDIPVESTTDLEALGSTSSTMNINDDDEMRILGDIEQEKDALSTLLLLSTNDTNQQQTFCKNADNSKDKENQEEDRILNDDDDNGDSYDGLRTTQKDNEDEQDDDSHGGGDDISDDLNKNEFKQQGEEKTIEPSPSNKLFVGSKCFKFDQIIEVPQGGGRDDTSIIKPQGHSSRKQSNQVNNDEDDGSEEEDQVESEDDDDKKSLQKRAFHQEKKKKPSIRRCTKPTTMSPNSKKEKTKELRRIKYQEKKKENEQIKTKEKIATLETELKQRNDDFAALQKENDRLKKVQADFLRQQNAIKRQVPAISSSRGSRTKHGASSYSGDGNFQINLNVRQNNFNSDLSIITSYCTRERSVQYAA